MIHGILLLQNVLKEKESYFELVIVLRNYHPVIEDIRFLCFKHAFKMKLLYLLSLLCSFLLEPYECSLDDWTKGFDKDKGKAKASW